MPAPRDPGVLHRQRRGSIDDHKVYQEVQGRRTIPLLQAYDYPYKVIDKPDEIDAFPMPTNGIACRSGRSSCS